MIPQRVFLVALAADVFDDGFESGDLRNWSEIQP
jgi:hypothetical protein